MEIEERLMTTSTADTPSAGHLLPKPFLADILVNIEQFGLARQLFRGIPMTSKTLDLKNISGKVAAAWATEGSNISADDLAFAEGQLEAGKLAGITSWTTELDEDQAIQLLPVTAELFGESFSEHEDQAAFLGNGTASFGGYTGITQLSNVQTHTFEAGNTTGDALTEDDLRATKNLLSAARQRGAVWIMHRTVKDHIEQFESTGGDRIFHENLATGGPGTLLGYPVRTSEVMPTLSGVGAGEPFIIFGNPLRSFMGMRRGLTADISREAVLQDESGSITFNAFQGDGVLLRLTERVGFKTPSAFEDSFATIVTAAS